MHSFLVALLSIVMLHVREVAEMYLETMIQQQVADTTTQKTT